MCTICSFFCTYAHPHKLLFTNLLFSRIIIFSIIYILGDQNPKSRRKRGCRYCDAKYLREKMQTVKNIISKWNSISLVKRIICGLIIGIILGLVVPQASGISILGDLFVAPFEASLPYWYSSCYELALPHGEGTEDQHEGDRNPVHGRQYSCSSLCRSSKLRIPDHPDLYREYRHQ